MNNDNQQIIILIFLVVFFGYLLVLCKSSKENFQMDTILSEDNSGDTLPNNCIPGDNIVEYPEPKGFRIINMKNDEIEIEFYSPETILCDDVLKLKENSNLSAEDNIYKYVVVLATYKNKNTTQSPIDDNFKTFYIDPENNNETNQFLKYNSNYYTYKIKVPTTEDEYGNKYYHRIGLFISYIYGENQGQSNIINVENSRIIGNNYYFQLQDQDVQQSDIAFEEYLKFKQEKPKEVKITTDTCEYGADGNLEFIKRNLGGYPDNLFLAERTGPKSLGELTKRQLSLGILDINVHNNL